MDLEELAAINPTYYRDAANDSFKWMDEGREKLSQCRRLLGELSDHCKFYIRDKAEQGLKFYCSRSV